MIKNEFVKRWESNPSARDELLEAGIIPLAKDLMDDKVGGRDVSSGWYWGSGYLTWLNRSKQHLSMA